MGPDGAAVRGLDEDDAPASAPERLDARRLNPANIPEPEVERDRATPCGVFDGAAPDASLGLASERCAEEERKWFLILSMPVTNGMRGVVRLLRFKSDKARNLSKCKLVSVRVRSPPNVERFPERLRGGRNRGARS